MRTRQTSHLLCYHSNPKLLREAKLEIFILPPHPSSLLCSCIMVPDSESYLRQTFVSCPPPPSFRCQVLLVLSLSVHSFVHSSVKPLLCARNLGSCQVVELSGVAAGSKIWATASVFI